jgi:flagellar L-ring protein FlgH
MKQAALLLLAGTVAWAQPADRYPAEAQARAMGATAPGASPGSLFQPGARLADLARDLRATQIDDIVTVVVLDRATAVTRGATTTQRQSSANATIPAIAGTYGGLLGNRLTNLLGLSGEQQLQGQGLTSRETNLATTLTTRVVSVLPNGNLLIEGVKDIQVNSERQQISVRGVIRTADLNPGNAIRSDRIANLEIRVNGKGVVGDAIRRPNLLYRILLGILPF